MTEDELQESGMEKLLKKQFCIAKFLNLIQDWAYRLQQPQWIYR